MDKNPISVSDLEYVTQTRGWNTIVKPHWEKQVKLLQNKFEASSRKTNDLSQLKYDRGYLDGYEAATKVVESILRGLRLRNKTVEQSSVPTDVKS